MHKRERLRRTSCHKLSPSPSVSLRSLRVPEDAAGKRVSLGSARRAVDAVALLANRLGVDDDEVRWLVDAERAEREKREQRGGAGDGALELAEAKVDEYEASLDKLSYEQVSLERNCCA